MLDHVKAAAITVCGIVKGLFLTVSPSAWRYRYRDALYEIRHGDEWCDYEPVADDSYIVYNETNPDPDGDRDYQGPADTDGFDDLKKEIDEALAVHGLKLEDLPVASSTVKEHESHFMFRPRSTKSRAQIYSDGPDGEQFNAMQD